MITTFNRKELFTTYSMEEQARIRQILSDNGINYVIKVHSHGSTHTRGRHGSAGICLDCMYQYIIYVRSADWELATHLIRK